MAEFSTLRSQVGARAAEIDAGLRAHMNKVYGTMSVGMLITALASWAIAGLATTTDPALATAQMNNGTMLTGLGVALYTSPLKWVVMLAPLGMIFGFGVRGDFDIASASLVPLLKKVCFSYFVCN